MSFKSMAYALTAALMLSAGIAQAAEKVNVVSEFEKAVQVAEEAAKKAGGEDPDKRPVLGVTTPERYWLLVEMRMFVTSIQRIIEALNNNDMKGVAEASRLMGVNASSKIPSPTVEKLPNEFKVLANNTHGLFDMIALDAETLADPKHTMEQLSQQLQYCYTCHEMYQVKTVDQKPAKKKK